MNSAITRPSTPLAIALDTSLAVGAYAENALVPIVEPPRKIVNGDRTGLPGVTGLDRGEAAKLIRKADFDATKGSLVTIHLCQGPSQWPEVGAGDPGDSAGLVAEAA